LRVMASPRFACQTLSPASQASQLPQVLWCHHSLKPACPTVGAGLLAMASPRFAC
jgi:hypothetical protein